LSAKCYQLRYPQKHDFHMFLRTLDEWHFRQMNGIQNYGITQNYSLLDMGVYEPTRIPLILTLINSA